MTLLTRGYVYYWKRRRRRIITNELGKRLPTCPQILVIQKTFLQRFTSYELLSVIKLLGFLLFFC